MTDVKTVFAEVLQSIQPTQKELILIDSIVQKLIKSLEKRAKELNLNYTTIEPQGSTGIKQTQLRNDFDIDLFIGLDFDSWKQKFKGLSKNRFKNSTKKEFRRLCYEWIIKSLNLKEFESPSLLYAEHPYVSVNYIGSSHKYKVDIVLYFDLSLEFIRKNGPITAVDRTPHHSRFIKENLSKKQKNDVRLLKQFFKACHSYGDKSPVGRAGFIGYSAELLLYHFGDVYDVLQNFKNLPNNTLDYFEREKSKLMKISHFRDDWLLLIDPIDKNRNVASAISKRAFNYCNYKINQFLNNPNKDYFKIKDIPEFQPEISRDISSNLFIMEFTKIKPDIHYTVIRDKLYSLGDYIVSHGETAFDHSPRFGNIIYEVYFEPKSNEYNLALFCEHPILDKYYERRGPPLKMEKDVQKFQKKHKNTFTRDGFVWIKTKRTYQNFINFLYTDKIVRRIPESLELKNISGAIKAMTSSGRKAVFVLEHMVLPFRDI
ncbi:MAG: hypothetical protein EU547_03830 [Promethearchaeota archaeon]|nr:MAG: hypothetical protein EU547_03830 [Candidatus Lokiarchaeota archaeon]